MTDRVTIQHKRDEIRIGGIYENVTAIQIEQVPIGELRHDPTMKQIEELNQAGMGVAGHILYRSKPRNQVGSFTR